MDQDLLFNIPLQDYRPINEMPNNREWTIIRNRLIVENSPPRRRIYLNYIVAYRRIGFKGLTRLFYEPESRRSELAESVVCFTTL